MGRRCAECRTAVPRGRDRCPSCGLTYTTSWRWKLTMLLIAMLITAAVMWVVVRYAGDGYGVYI